jgi:cell division transport system ATP-binding protein
MIQMYHVSKQYPPNIHALLDVTLFVEKGEFVFLTGHSGAGKSTLLRLITRGELPASGQIVVSGRNVLTLSPGKIPFFRRQIGVVFQDIKLINRKTIFENIAFILSVMGIPLAEQKKRVYQILKLVGLHHRMNALPHQLSGGEQQRVAIARALINHPPLLIADEPTGNLDETMAWEVMTLFEKLNMKGTTIVMATHNRQIVETMKRRVVHLDKGRILHDTGAKKEMTL